MVLILKLHRDEVALYYFNIDDDFILILHRIRDDRMTHTPG